MTSQPACSTACELIATQRDLKSNVRTQRNVRSITAREHYVISNVSNCCPFKREISGQDTPSKPRSCIFFICAIRHGWEVNCSRKKQLAVMLHWHFIHSRADVWYALYGTADMNVLFPCPPFDIFLCLLLRQLILHSFYIRAKNHMYLVLLRKTDLKLTCY